MDGAKFSEFSSVVLLSLLTSPVENKLFTPSSELLLKLMKTGPIVVMCDTSGPISNGITIVEFCLLSFVIIACANK